MQPGRPKSGVKTAADGGPEAECCAVLKRRFDEAVFLLLWY
jgi:hypothetical protein